MKWYKKDGEWVNRDEVIAELESEKATFELNAEQAGAIKIIAKEGDTLNIGDVVCSIDTDAAKPVTAIVEEKKTVTETLAPKSQTQNTKPGTELKATPVAAAIIADKKVDVKEVMPSGSNGRIVKQDVMDALNNPGRRPGTVMFERNDRVEK